MDKMSTLNFAKAIKKLLNTESINKLVDNKVYPLVAPLETEFPYIVFQRTDTTNYSKDNRYQSELTYNVIVASDDYDESIELADSVIGELSGKRNIEIGDWKISSIRCGNSSESYNDAYLQSLTFIFKVNLN